VHRSENGLTSAQLGQLHLAKPLVAEYCRRLALSIPEGLNHGDFHNSNVFVSRIVLSSSIGAMPA
jgi:hypothetical protein